MTSETPGPVSGSHERTTGEQARLLLLIGLAGLAVTAILFWRGQPFGDQLSLLARGWRLAARGELVPYGNPLSTGGHEPGALTSLLVGLPLFVWMDPRAPVALIVLAHLLAWWLLDRVAGEALGGRGRVLLAVLFWLSPWRLYFSGFLWNPNYMFLFGAMHLWSAWRQADRARFWPSLVQALAIGLAFQLHASFILLAVTSGLLWWRGYQRLNVRGIACGAALASLTLIPWALSLSAHPEITAASKGFPGFGLVAVYPVVRGLMYWVRYGSLAVSEHMLRFDFTEFVGARADAWTAPAAVWAARVTGAISLPFSAWAPWGPLHSKGRGWLRSLRVEGRPPDSGRDWLGGYAVCSLAAAFLVFCLSPTTIMFWQALPLFHAALIPLLLWGMELLEGPRAAWARRAAATIATVSIVMGLAMAGGARQYRCEGRGHGRWPLSYDSSMFDDLGMRSRCPWPVNVDGGGWPDGLPPEGPMAP